MIIRIMGEGQWRVDDALVADLNVIDSALDRDVDAGEAGSLDSHLEQMHALVKGRGTPLAIDELLPSDAVVPPLGISLEELRVLAGEEGLIPG